MFTGLLKSDNVPYSVTYCQSKTQLLSILEGENKTTDDTDDDEDKNDSSDDNDEVR